MPKSYIVKEWAYPVLLFFFLFTFLMLFLSSVGLVIFSFWQKILIFFISAGGEGLIIHRVIFSILYFLLILLFLYLLKLEFFPTFLEKLTILKTDDGNIDISQKAIWDIVERKLKEFPYVKNLKMYIVKSYEEFVLYLKVDLVGDDSDLADIEKKAYKISKGIREYIYEGTGIRIEKVNIEIERLKYEFREEEKDEPGEQRPLDE